MAGRITVTAEIVGTGSDGTEPSVVFAVHRHGVYSTDRTLLKRYLFNCGEGTQRLCGENGIKLNSLDAIFLTRISYSLQSTSGVPGLVFALGGVGAAHLRVHGPIGTRDRLSAMESFVRRKYPTIECVEIESPGSERKPDENLLSEIKRTRLASGEPTEDHFARIIAVPLSTVSGTQRPCWVCEKCSPLVERKTVVSKPQAVIREDDQDADRLWLRRFYESKGLHEKIPHMDAILRRYRGRVDELKVQLTNKYGDVDDSSASCSSDSESGDDESQQHTRTAFDANGPLDREWLEEFYQRYEPTKLARVDQVLRQFAGREEQLKAMLLAKYGHTNRGPAVTPPTKKQKTDQYAGRQEDSIPVLESPIPEYVVCQPQELPSDSREEPSTSFCYVMQFRSSPFPVAWIVDCPTVDLLDSLSTQLVVSECGHRPVLVVHFSPTRVINHSKYQAWIKALHGAAETSIEHVMFDGAALRKADGGIFSFAFIASAHHYLKNQGEIDIPISSRWDNLRSRLAGRTSASKQSVSPSSLQLRIRKQLIGSQLLATVAQAKLKYTLQDTALEDYSQTGWKYTVDKKVGDEEDQQALLNSSKPASQDGKTGLHLTILGTGSAAPSKLRASTSIYLSLSAESSDDKQPGLLIDCGEGAFGQLQRQFDSEDDLATRIAGLKCIWISHHHADHQCGLLRVLDEYVRVTQPSSLPSTTLLVIAPHSVLAYVKAWLPDLPSSISLMTCTAMNDNYHAVNTHLGKYIHSMRNIRVWHCHDAFGLVVCLRNGTKLVYSGDTKPCDQLVRVGMDASLLIHEATFDDTMEDDADKKKHSTVGQAIEVARRMRAKRVVLTHFSQRYPALPPPVSNSPGPAKDQERHSPLEILCAYDGFTIHL